VRARILLRAGVHHVRSEVTGGGKILALCCSLELIARGKGEKKIWFARKTKESPPHTSRVSIPARGLIGPEKKNKW